MPDLRVERTQHSDYGSCLHLSNGLVNIYVSLEYGPRILHYSLGEGPNVMFFNRDPEYVKKGEEFDKVFYPGAYWNIRGGNRLWVAPHSYPGAFYPDNEAVEFQILEKGARFLPKPRWKPGVRLSTEVELEGATSGLRVRNIIQNIGDTPLRMAAWSITSVESGGIEIIPQPGRQTGVLPNRRLALWPYTDMADPRLTWGSRHIALRHDSGRKEPLKLGINNEEGWACYVNQGQCFLIEHHHDIAAEYPDFGVSYETFADDRMVEMETLSPLKLVRPGESVEQNEYWQLCAVGGEPDVGSEESLSSFVDSIFSNAMIVAPEGSYSGGLLGNPRGNS